MNFTRDQLDAVDIAKRHLDTCVVAGPGSGKTTVLVEYFSAARAWSRRGWTRCASWPSPSPRRPRATCGRSWPRSFRTIPNPRQTGARLGLDGPRFLRAPVAGERRLRGSRPGVPHRGGERSVAHAAGIHRRGHRCAVSRAPRPAAGADPRPVFVRIRRGGSLGLRHHARRGRAGGGSGRLSRSRKASPPARSPP